MHPDSKQARSITVREAAALQSFDDDFEFTGKIGIDYKMIGNAVPPLMAKKISKILPISPKNIKSQLESVLSDFQIDYLFKNHRC